MNNKCSYRFRTAECRADDFEPKHNAENRPVRWVQGDTVVTMGFDRMGRRVFYKEMEGDTQVTHTVFLYNGYTCIQQLFSNSPWNVYKEFIWDPTETIATRPLCFRQYGETAAFYLHDGNKNVSDVVTVAPYNTIVAHYDYAPFGATTASGTRASDNPYRFSSEYTDDTLGLVYYNYRHYNPIDGRWLSREPLEEDEFPYLFILNNPQNATDALGLETINIVGGPGAMANSVIFDPNRPTPKPLSTVEEFIPVYSSIRSMDYELYNGNYFHGLINIGEAALDTSLLSTIVTGLSKGCWKTGSHTWRATRKWYGKKVTLPKNTHVHHQFIPQNGWGKHIPNVIKNQPWNLNPIYGQMVNGKFRKSSELHQFIHHGITADVKIFKFQLWDIQYSTGAKLFQGSLLLHIEETLSFEKEGEADDIYLDGEKIE